jgi:hypothetical protein
MVIVSTLQLVPIEKGAWGLHHGQAERRIPQMLAFTTVAPLLHRNSGDCGIGKTQCCTGPGVPPFRQRSYQLDLMTPGIFPSKAIRRKQIRQSWKRRI